MDALLYEKIERYISKHRTADGARHLRMLCGCYDLDTIEDAIANANESFSEMLFRLIREKGISEVECYKRAGISRQLFSKIRSNSGYNPSRNTAIALAISLCLSLKETAELLETAGFALSHSSKADLIIEYFIVNSIWRLADINDALYSFGEEPISV